VPDHPTEIEYTFKEPGRYQIVCLEFCGVDHHRMLGSFTVRAAA
jgi:cytochrome c oxidase subunit 2